MTSLPTARIISKEMANAINKDLADAIQKIKQYNKEHNIIECDDSKIHKKKIFRRKVLVKDVEDIIEVSKVSNFRNNDINNLGWHLGHFDDAIESEEARRWRLEYKKQYELERAKVEEEEREDRLRRDKIAEKNLKRFKIYGRL